ncbi:hypothetical protein ACF07W_37545 [Streptomyces sp. NPDC015140]|uniref:hypothetical protein n=1 Tax=Streptomyces sp. NPDC015140 TaxID=3364943 RepID=UPI0036F5A421
MHGHGQDESLGSACRDHDLVVFLKGAAAEPEAILDDPQGVELRHEVLDEQVALKSTTWEERAEMYYAPVGAQPPTLASSPTPEGGAPSEQGI